MEYDVHDVDLPPPYHNGDGARKAARAAILAGRLFVFWDGEGAKSNAPGKNLPQDYVLLGYYDGTEHRYITGAQLTTLECLALIIECGRAHKGAWHVSFSFGYDVNMILRNLSPKHFAYLKEHNFTRVGDHYRVEHIPGKWFKVTEFGPTFPANRKDRYSVTIFDLWGFFQSSFIKAIKSYIPDHPLMAHLPEIEAGKAKRDQFTHSDMDYIIKYWSIENELAWHLVNRLRTYLYDVGLRISSWHGPGALAAFTYRHNRVRGHTADCGADIYDAARYAYAGGRFERFSVGRTGHTFGYDLNSAYPAAIALLPSLSEGQWLRIERPSSLALFGIYRVRMRGPGIARAPAPLFHRDRAGNITYPWRLDGWYWGPELRVMVDTLPELESFQIMEGYEYVGWHTRPFAFVHEMYDERRALKAAGIGAQIALKLCLNSLYGKQAQRAGWERTGKAPSWHQLEWAGWVTSYTRARLFEIMHRIPKGKLIAVETDGIYTTATPDELGITPSTELGGWEITEHDEMVYLQSGLYAKRQGSEWSMKYRGLDADSISASQIVEHSKRLAPNEREWPALKGTTTRFIGYENALFREEQNRGPMKAHHRVWETSPKEISCAAMGKRVHSYRMCAACKAGATAYEMPHETVIKSITTLQTTGDALMSTRHYIPWLDDPKDRPEWLTMQEEQEGMLTE